MKLHLSILLPLLLSSFNVFADSISHEYSYHALSTDNKLTSRIIAIDNVRSFLLKNIGSHIKQTIPISEYGSTNSYKLKNVEAVTANLTKLKIIEEKWDQNIYYVKAEIDTDIQSILIALKKYKKDRSEETQQLLKALIINEQMLQKSREKITRLRKTLKQSNKDFQDTKTSDDYLTEVDRISTEIEFSKAFKLHQQGNYREAINNYRKISTQGNVVAQQLLGSLYMSGTGIEQDYDKALYWLKKAAEQDEAIAQYYLGLLYFEGKGVKQDFPIAIEWLHKSADHEHALAQYQLGNMYLNGTGVKQQYFMAAHWFRKAANQQIATAQLQLGNLYYYGKGLAKNQEEALRWYKKAAEQDLNEAKALIKSLDKINK